MQKLLRRVMFDQVSELHSQPSGQVISTILGFSRKSVAPCTRAAHGPTLSRAGVWVWPVSNFAEVISMPLSRWALMGGARQKTESHCDGKAGASLHEPRGPSRGRVCPDHSEPCADTASV